MSALENASQNMQDMSNFLEKQQTIEFDLEKEIKRYIYKHAIQLKKRQLKHFKKLIQDDRSTEVQNELIDMIDLLYQYKQSPGDKKIKDRISNKLETTEFETLIRISSYLFGKNPIQVLAENHHISSATAEELKKLVGKKHNLFHTMKTLGLSRLPKGKFIEVILSENSDQIASVVNMLKNGL